MIVEWLQQHGSWVLAGTGTTALLTASWRPRIGWPIGIVSQAVWTVYGTVTEQWGFIAQAAIFTAAYGLHTWQAWRPVLSDRRTADQLVTAASALRAEMRRCHDAIAAAEVSPGQTHRSVDQLTGLQVGLQIAIDVIAENGAVSRDDERVLEMAT